MGSGRGQARRVKGMSATTQAIVGDYGVWESFVTDAGLKGKSICDYYGIGTRHQASKSWLNEQEQIELAIEIFKDLVAMGAISLELGRTTDDYSFFVQHPEHIHPRLQVAHKDTPEQAGTVLSSPEYLLNNQAMFGSGHEQRIVFGILDGIERADGKSS